MQAAMPRGLKRPLDHGHYHNGSVAGVSRSYGQNPNGPVNFPLICGHDELTAAGTNREADTSRGINDFAAFGAFWNLQLIVPMPKATAVESHATAFSRCFATSTKNLLRFASPDDKSHPRQQESIQRGWTRPFKNCQSHPGAQSRTFLLVYALKT
jgi:hypothetical protein